MQYTLRRIPKVVDRELRAAARRTRRSLNEVALEALERGLGLTAEVRAHRDLTDVAGQWHDDPEIDRALAEQRQVDEALWR